MSEVLPLSVAGQVGRTSEGAPHLRAYPAYKDSGVPWLGDVPAHWDVRRQRNIVYLVVSNVDKHTHEGEYPVRLCNYVDVYKNDTITDRIPFMRATASQEEINRFRLRIGDVVITKDSETWDDIGVPALVNYEAPDFVCGYHLAILRPRKDVIYGEYLLRALQSRNVAVQHYVAANGITRYGLSQDAIKSVWIPLPPLPEQRAIAAFLTHYDRLTRRYIHAQQRLIKLLTEQKQALIQQAVTRGLDPDVPLKDSGIAWLGKIPAHWLGLPLKRWVSTKITDGPHETPPLIDYGIDFMSAESIVDGHFDFSHRRGFISPELHEQYCKKCKPQLDDIFMCKSGATTGKVAMVETNKEFSVWSPLALIRSDQKRVIPKLLYYVLQSKYIQQQVQNTWSAGTQPNLSMGAMERLYVVLPALKEQEAILRIVEAQVNKINTTIDRAHRQIALVREYRTRLIADVVTGKLDVRGFEVGRTSESAPHLDDDAWADLEDEETDDVLDDLDVV